MPVVDSILPELEREAATTHKVLAIVPDAKLTWKPHARSMSLGELAWHLASIPAGIMHAASLDSLDVSQFVPKPHPDTTAEMVAAFDACVAEARHTLAGWSDERALSGWRLTRGEKVLVQMPRIALIRTILMNHSYHHRGQLSVYLRLLDVPLPSIYGPSADEDPFA